MELDPEVHLPLVALAAAEFSASTKHHYGFNPLHLIFFSILQKFLLPEICFKLLQALQLLGEV